MNNPDELVFTDALSSWDQELGLGEDSAELKLESGMSSDVVAKVGEIAKNASPEPPKVGGNDKTLPEDLKVLETELELPYKKEDTTDYKKLFEDNFGESQTEINGREDYEQQATLIYYEDQYLKQFNLEAANALIEGKIEKDKVVRSMVEANLKTAGIFSQRLFDEQITELISEGQLTAEGDAKYNEIIEKQKQAVENWKKEAKGHAKAQWDELKKINQLRTEKATSFKPLGLEMPQEWGEHLTGFITGGGLHDFITNPNSDEDTVERELWMAIVASPKARSEFFKKIYEKGVNYGLTQKAKKVFGQ